MSQALRSLLAAALAAALMSIAACREPASPTKTVVVLVEPGTEVRLERPLGTVLEEIGPGDRLVLALLADRASPAPELIAQEHFDAFEPPTDNPRIVRSMREEHDAMLTGRRIEIARLATEQVAAGVERGRDGLSVLGSMELAERTFRAHPAEIRSLVILSTMVERSGWVDLDEEEMTPERTREVLESLQAAGLLPDLRGIRVHVAGAGHADPGRASEIRDFWASYFEAVGAQLRREDYGRDLLRYDLD